MATARPQRREALSPDKGGGWLAFAGIVLMIAGVLNVIYGIAALGNSHFFAQHTDYMFGTLNTWGWVVLVLGALQIVAAGSIWAGGQFGRFFGILIAGLSAIGALLAIPAYPFWSLVIFAVDILIIYGLAAYGGQRSSAS
jgi:hypothetical protein